MLFTWLVRACQRHLSRLTWPALSGLFFGQYLTCYIVFKLLNETAIFARPDEQTFTAAFSLAVFLPEQCHTVVYLEDERYAGLLESHCPRMEIAWQETGVVK